MFTSYCILPTAVERLLSTATAHTQAQVPDSVAKKYMDKLLDRRCCIRNPTALTSQCLDSCLEKRHNTINIHVFSCYSRSGGGVVDYKYLSCVYGVDRKICHEGH